MKSTGGGSNRKRSNCSRGLSSKFEESPVSGPGECSCKSAIVAGDASGDADSTIEWGDRSEVCV